MFVKLYLVPKETEFNIEQRIKSPPSGLLDKCFVAENTAMGFSLTEMLGRYLRKYGVQNKWVFVNIFIFKQS